MIIDIAVLPKNISSPSHFFSSVLSPLLHVVGFCLGFAIAGYLIPFIWKRFSTKLPSRRVSLFLRSLLGIIFALIGGNLGDYSGWSSGGTGNENKYQSSLDHSEKKITSPNTEEKKIEIPSKNEKPKTGKQGNGPAAHTFTIIVLGGKVTKDRYYRLEDSGKSEDLTLEELTTKILEYKEVSEGVKRYLYVKIYQDSAARDTLVVFQLEQWAKENGFEIIFPNTGKQNRPK